MSSIAGGGVVCAGFIFSIFWGDFGVFWGSNITGRRCGRPHAAWDFANFWVDSGIIVV